MDDNMKSISFSSLPDAAIASDRELLMELQQWTSNGLIFVEDNSDPYFALLQSKYPIGVNCVDWRFVEDVEFLAILPLEKREHSPEERHAALDRSIPIIRDWFAKNSIGQEDRVIVLGDVSRVALHMTVNTLLQCCHIIFLSPQHVYAIPPSADWCLNHMMKDLLWFGIAAKAVRTGWVYEAEQG